MGGHERLRQSAQVTQHGIRLLAHLSLAPQENPLALEHGLHGWLILFATVVQLGDLRPGLSAHHGMCPLVGGQLTEERLGGNFLLQPTQQSRLEQMGFQIVWFRPQAIFDQ